MKADTLDLARLARIESNIMSKFPNFTGFEQFGYGSFLHFLTSYKKLSQALEEVGGGMVRAGREGARTEQKVSLDSVLDFILQCGTQTSPVSLPFIAARTMFQCLGCYPREINFIRLLALIHAI